MKHFLLLSALFNLLFAVSNAAAQAGAPTPEEFASQFAATRVAKCDGSNYVLYSPVGAYLGNTPKATLLEVRRYWHSSAASPISEADRLNGIEWRGALTIQFDTYRSWDRSKRSWSQWSPGMPTVSPRELSAAIYQTRGQTVMDRPDYLPARLQLINCRDVANQLEAIDASGASALLDDTVHRIVAKAFEDIVGCRGRVTNTRRSPAPDDRGMHYIYSESTCHLSGPSPTKILIIARQNPLMTQWLGWSVSVDFSREATFRIPDSNQAMAKATVPVK